MGSSVGHLAEEARHPKRGRTSNEANLSTEQQEAEANAWIHGSHENEGRPARAQAASCQRAAAAGRVAQRGGERPAPTERSEAVRQGLPRRIPLERASVHDRGEPGKGRNDAAGALGQSANRNGSGAESRQAADQRGVSKLVVGCIWRARGGRGRSRGPSRWRPGGSRRRAG